MINENYQSQIKSSSDEKERMLNVGSLILKYGGLASTIVKAETSDDVESAIDAVALPAGSSRIKRETHFNVALNAYCGLFAGRDKINIKSSSQDYSYGVTAPIGISASWGIKHNSLSVFVSIVDLGAITAFRFVNDTAKTISKIQLKDIISPGLFISWGIPKCPISVNAGYQITPSLEAIDAKGNTLQSSLSRLSIGVCVDIPVLNFYTKPKN